MKTRVLLTLLILFPLLGGCTECSRADAGVVVDAEQSVVSPPLFDHTSHNFGVINEVDGVVAHTFTFTNSGESAMVIERVVITCGCTTPEYSEKPILPGRKGEIKVVFDPYRRPGVFAKSVTVVTNKGRSRSELMVSGEVVPRPLTLEEQYPFVSESGLRFSASFLNFREIAESRVASMVVGYHNTSAKTLPFSLDARALGAMVVISAPTKIGAGERGDITVTLTPPKGSHGSFKQRLYPTIGGVSTERVDGGYSLFMQGVVVDDFSGVDKEQGALIEIEPSYGEVEGLRQGERGSVEFELRNRGGSDLIIRAVECGDNVFTDLKVGRLIKPNKIATFSVGIDATQLDIGLYTNTITLVINDPHRPVYVLRVLADVGSKQ